MSGRWRRPATGVPGCTGYGVRPPGRGAGERGAPGHRAAGPAGTSSSSTTSRATATTSGSRRTRFGRRRRRAAGRPPLPRHLPRRLAGGAAQRRRAGPHRGAALAQHAELTGLRWDAEVLIDEPDEVAVRLTVAARRIPAAPDQGAAAAGRRGAAVGRGGPHQHRAGPGRGDVGPASRVRRAVPAARARSRCPTASRSPRTPRRSTRRIGRCGPAARTPGRSCPSPDGGTTDLSMVPEPGAPSDIVYLSGFGDNGWYELRDPARRHRHAGGVGRDRPAVPVALARARRDHRLAVVGPGVRGRAGTVLELPDRGLAAAVDERHRTDPGTTRDTSPDVGRRGGLGWVTSTARWRWSPAARWASARRWWSGWWPAAPSVAFCGREPERGRGAGARGSAPGVRRGRRRDRPGGDGGRSSPASVEPVRRPGHRGDQRRHPALRHGRGDLRRALGRGARRQPQGRLPRLPGGHAAPAGPGRRRDRRRLLRAGVRVAAGRGRVRRQQGRHQRAGPLDGAGPRRATDIRVNAVCPGSVDTPMLRWAADLYKGDVDGRGDGGHLGPHASARPGRPRPPRWPRWSPSSPATAPRSSPARSTGSTAACSPSIPAALPQ